MGKMKPTKCWSCKYVAKCMNTHQGKCEKFDKWGLTLKDLAELSGINYNTLNFMLCKNEVATLIKIEKTTGRKFKVVKEDGKRIFVEVEK